MDSYLISISLPSNIKKSLSSLCYGIPHAQWLEEDAFHLTLQYFGPLADLDFSVLQELKGNKGILCVGIRNSNDLIALKKEVNHCLRNFPLHSKERSFHPHVTLGRLDKIHPVKLGDYLMVHNSFESDPFEVSCCQLLIARQTPKRIFYQTVAQYEASTPATGED